MRCFQSELAHNYKTYTFGYADYCEREANDQLADIYAAGYLPYSGAKDVRDIFYRARSARVPLKEWRATSENRRIAKKFDGAFVKTRVPFFEFTVDEQFLQFCLAYFAQKHGAQAMSEARLRSILRSGLLSSITVYTKDNKPAAYVLEAADHRMGHYWFSFYDLTLAKQSLGLWLMLDHVRDAKDRGLLHYYVGTVYGEKALYKTNFEPMEWWDGSGWNTDIPLLKHRGRHDGVRGVPLSDEWKEGKSLF